MKAPKLFILVFLFSASLACALPTAPLNVAVYDFKGDGPAASYGNNITTLVTADLATETNLVLLERADLSKILNEQAFDISGMVSSDAAAKIGQVTGVQVLVAGQVIKTEGDHLVVIASIIGTETSRLFAVRAEGAAGNLMPLTSDLSRQIARTISQQRTNLVAPPAESHATRVERIVKSIQGKQRPSVSINLTANNGLGQNWRDTISENELGSLLLKAGFPVVDEHADKKADVEIIGSSSTETGLPRGGLLTGRATVQLRVQERRTGNIISFDSQEATATDLGVTAASQQAQIKAMDELAARILPLLAK